MNIDELTIGEARQLVGLFSGINVNLPVENPWVIGQAYHIRTVTHYWTGMLVSVTEQELVLEDAAWIADTGRFANFFTDGPKEVEPVDGPVIIGRGAVIDAQVWTVIALPRIQK